MKCFQIDSSNVYFTYEFKTISELLLSSHVSRVIRYEDLSLHPYEITADILKFYGLPFHGNVKKFLDSVTKKCSKFNYNCRESKVDPFHWTRDLNFSEVTLLASIMGYLFK